jgi:biotin carboxyl carrier protein
VSDDSFKVEVDSRTFEIDTADGSISVDKRPVRASVRHVSGNTYSMLVDGQSHEFTIESDGPNSTISGVAGTQEVSIYDRLSLLLKETESAAKNVHGAQVRAPMPGLVLKIEVAAGQSVSMGTGLLVLEAMKMENEIFSSSDAVVEQIHVGEGDAVTKGQLLVSLGRSD